MKKNRFPFESKLLPNVSMNKNGVCWKSFPDELDATGFPKITLLSYRESEPIEDEARAAGYTYSYTAHQWA